MEPDVPESEFIRAYPYQEEIDEPPVFRFPTMQCSAAS